MYSKAHKLQVLKKLGWTVYIVECTDGSYFSGMTRNIQKELYRINVLRHGVFFRTHPKRVPVNLIFEEKNLPFREALAKYSYLKEMNKPHKRRLVKTKVWANSWMLYKRGYRQELNF